MINRSVTAAEEEDEEMAEEGEEEEEEEPEEGVSVASKTIQIRHQRGTYACYSICVGEARDPNDGRGV